MINTARSGFRTGVVLALAVATCVTSAYAQSTGESAAAGAAATFGAEPATVDPPAASAIAPASEAGTADTGVDTDAVVSGGHAAGGDPGDASNVAGGAAASDAGTADSTVDTEAGVSSAQSAAPAPGMDAFVSGSGDLSSEAAGALVAPGDAAVSRSGADLEQGAGSRSTSGPSRSRVYPDSGAPWLYDAIVELRRPKPDANKAVVSPEATSGQ